MTVDRVEHIVSKRKWEQLERLLPVLTPNECYLADSKCCVDCSKRHNLLHYILRFNPPISTVQSVVRKDPKAPFDLDCMNRYPLHIAMIYGISAEVVEYLVEINKESVLTVDIEDKTILHLYFQYYKQRRKLKKQLFNETKCYTADIVQLICRTEPRLVLEEDNEEFNVLESAIEAEIDYSIIRMLQKVAEHALKGKPIPWEKLINSGRTLVQLDPVEDSKESIQKIVGVKALKKSFAIQKPQLGKYLFKVRKTVLSRSA